MSKLGQTLAKLKEDMAKFVSFHSETIPIVTVADVLKENSVPIKNDVTDNWTPVDILSTPLNNMAMNLQQYQSNATLSIILKIGKVEKSST